MRRALVVSLSIVVAVVCCADTVHLQNGSALEGKIEKIEDGALTLVLAKGGSITLSMESVASVEYGKTALEELKEKRAALSPDSASSHVVLAKWCELNKLDKEARELYRKAVEIDPSHAAARTALGHIRDKETGEWMTRGEYHRARGKVYFEGSWISPEEKQKLVTAKQRKEQLREMLRLIYIAARTSDGRNDARFAEVMKELEAYPKEQLEEFLIYCLDRQLTIKLFALQEIAARKIERAVGPLVDMAVKGGSSEVRLAAFRTLKQLKVENAWYFFSKYLYDDLSIYRIYALQGLLVFKDLRSVQYIIHSFPIALADAPPGGLTTSVSSTYIRGYEVIPRNSGVGLPNLVRPLIGTNRTGIGLQNDTMSSDEKKRRAEIFLRYRALELITDLPFGSDLTMWKEWWVKEGPAAVKAFLHEKKKETEAENKDPAPKAEPPPALMD